MMKDKIKYCLLFVAVKALAIWPYWVLHALSSVLYPIVYYIVRYRRGVTRKNLVNAFPEKTEKEIVKIEKAFYRHFCDYVVETLKLMHISDEQMKRHMRFTNPEFVEQLRQDGRPIFLYLGHHGNWEYVISITMWIHSDIEAVPFNRGFYSVDLKYFFKITLAVFTGLGRPTEVEGLASFNKKVILFGSEGNAKMFASKYKEDAFDPQLWRKTNIKENKHKYKRKFKNSFSR